jgi:hypothetical protein
MRVPVANYGAFLVTFPRADSLGTSYGEWNDRDRSDGLELYHTYHVNEAGRVGEVEYNMRDTTCKFFEILGEDAEILKSYYKDFRANRNREVAAARGW